MVESIYRSANIEGIGVTFPETQTICDGMGVANHTIDEIDAVCDLKRAWQWIFSNIDAETNLETLKNLNRIVGRNTVTNAGSIRTMFDEPIRVVVRDKDYYPPLPPSDAVIESELSKITEKPDLSHAMALFSYVAKGQFFLDGNKRTATLMANHFMIKNGLGIFSIPLDRKLDFYNALTSYYMSEGEKENLVRFLSENCVTRESEKKLSEKIELARKNCSLTIEEVSRRTAIPAETLLAYESGKHDIPERDLRLLSDLFQSVP